MERVLQIAAVVLVIAAAYFLWRGVTDWAFTFGVLAACSVLVSIRFQIKTRIAEDSEVEAEDESLLTEQGLEDAVNTGEKPPENITLQS